MYFEDVDLSWRIKLAGYKIKPLATAPIYHVGSATSNITPGKLWDPSPFFAFEMTKNYIYCWLKNSRSRTIVAYSPIISCVVLSMCFLALIRMKPEIFVAHIKGILWTMFNAKSIHKKRTEIGRMRKYQSDDILFVEQTVKGSTNLTYGIRKMLSMIKQATKR
jgi:GT2 family glycosyltransferase